MGIKLTNNAFGTLAAGINSSATSITLTTGQGARFPTLSAGDYFYATLIDTSNNLEIVKCTARSTDVLTVTRAQELTTARAYSTGDRIEIRITAATFEEASGIEDGEVTAAKLSATAVTDKLGYTPVNKTGDTMTGTLTLPALNVNSGTRTPNGDTFSAVVKGAGSGTRTMYFDSGTNLQGASVWWGANSTPHFAMDSNGLGGINWWVHAGGSWVRRHVIDENGQHFSTTASNSTMVPAYYARAWCNVRGDCGINGSGNVSSCSDFGANFPTQYMQVNLTTAMIDRNYAVVTGFGGLFRQYNTGEAIGDTDNTSLKTTSMFQIDINGTAANSDFMFAIFR